MGIELKGSSSDPVPAGGYTAKIKDVKVTNMQFGETLVWTMEIVDSNFPELCGMTVGCLSSTKISDQSKLGGWLKKAFNITLDVGETLNTDALVGKILRVRVKQETKYNKQNQPYAQSNIDAWGAYDPNNPKHSKPIEMAGASTRSSSQAVPPTRQNVQGQGTAQQSIPPTANPPAATPPPQTGGEFSDDEDIDF